MTNRLALHHILTTQLRKDWEQEDPDKTRLSQLARRDRIKASLRSTQMPGRHLMPDTRKTYDNMVARIHSTMKCKHFIRGKLHTSRKSLKRMIGFLNTF